MTQKKEKMQQFLVRFVADCLPTNYFLACFDPAYLGLCHRCSGTETQQHLLSCPAMQDFNQTQYNNFKALLLGRKLPETLYHYFLRVTDKWIHPSPSYIVDEFPSFAAIVGIYPKSVRIHLQKHYIKEGLPNQATDTLKNINTYWWKWIQSCWNEQCADFHKGSDPTSPLPKEEYLCSALQSQLTVQQETANTSKRKHYLQRTIKSLSKKKSNSKATTVISNSLDQSTIPSHNKGTAFDSAGHQLIPRPRKLGTLSDLVVVDQSARPRPNQNKPDPPTPRRKQRTIPEIYTMTLSPKILQRLPKRSRRATCIKITATKATDIASKIHRTQNRSKQT